MLQRLRELTACTGLAVLLPRSTHRDLQAHLDSGLKSYLPVWFLFFFSGRDDRGSRQGTYCSPLPLAPPLPLPASGHLLLAAATGTAAATASAEKLSGGIEVLEKLLFLLGRHCKGF